jgi:hypothetical protein
MLAGAHLRRLMLAGAHACQSGTTWFLESGHATCKSTEDVYPGPQAGQRDTGQADVRRAGRRLPDLTGMPGSAPRRLERGQIGAERLGIRHGGGMLFIGSSRLCSTGVMPKTPLLVLSASQAEQLGAALSEAAKRRRSIDFEIRYDDNCHVVEIVVAWGTGVGNWISIR